MRKLRTKIISFVAIALALATVIIMISGCAEAMAKIPNPTDGFYVNDFAGIFSSEQKKLMQERAVKFADRTDGIQVVVSTVKSLDGLSIEDYATDMYNKYEIGKDDKGVLILFSTGEREIKFEVGYGLEDILTDSKTGKLIDSIIDDLRNNKFAEGLVKLQKITIDEIAKYVPTTSTVEEKKVVTTTDTSSNKTDKKAEQPKQPKKESTQKTTETPQKIMGNDNSNDNIITLIIAIILFLIIYIVTTVYLVLKKKDAEFQLEETNKSLLRSAEETKKVSSSNTRLQSEIARLEEVSNRQVSQIERLSRETHSLKNDNEHLESENDSLTDQISSLRSNCTSLEQRINELSASNQDLMDKIALIYRVHPKLDEDINKYYAQEFDKKYSSLQKAAASSKSISRYKECMDAFNSLSAAVKPFVTVDMSAIKSLYADSCTLKHKEDANAFNQMVKNTIGSLTKGTEAMLPNLRGLKSKYNQLPSPVKKYVDSSLITRLNALISDGEEDQRAREEAERRKHQAEASDFEEFVNHKIGTISIGTEKLLPDLNILMDNYSRLSAPVKQFVDPSVVNRIKKLISEGEEEKRRREQREREERERQEEAENFRKMVDRKIGSTYTGTERMLDDLEDLKSKYNRLSSPVQEIIGYSVISRINDLISEGEADRRRRKQREEEERRRREREEEEEERRRRRSMSSGSSWGSSSSSFGGSSFGHHGGLGGHSGGGGASRRF